jgi:hypothetical protein
MKSAVINKYITSLSMQERNDALISTIARLQSEMQFLKQQNRRLLVQLLLIRSPFMVDIATQTGETTACISVAISTELPVLAGQSAAIDVTKTTTPTKDYSHSKSLLVFDTPLPIQRPDNIVKGGTSNESALLKLSTINKQNPQPLWTNDSNITSSPSQKRVTQHLLHQMQLSSIMDQTHSSTGRASLRTRSTPVSYQEPSLKTKVRKSTKFFEFH